MDAFLTALRTEGRLDSSGRFTIDRLRVTELYENAQKLEPCLYFLKAIQAAVAAGKTVPTDYLLWALLYCILYSSIAMLLALLMFEDRDLA